MNRTNNVLPLALMVTSVILLIVLQALWLRSAYNEGESRFLKETNGLFRSTILAMHDSLVQQRIEPLQHDSLVTILHSKTLKFREDARPMRLKDTTRTYSAESKIEVFVSSETADSLPRMIRPLMNKIRGDGHKTFIIRMGPDSLKVDSIKKEFSQVLEAAGLATPFSVISIRSEPFDESEKTIAGKYVSERVRISPLNEYAVSFSGIGSMVLREITPQILFSIFLTLLTIGSFTVMYRNLRAQEKLMNLKNDFISNVTHELKTPVATVSVALEALRNFNALHDPKRTEEYLEIAQNELNRLTLMTDKILKTSVFETQGIVVKIEKINIDSLVQQVLNSMKLVFEKRSVAVEFLREGNDFEMEGSRADITHVLYNLLDNALKYSLDGTQIRLGLHDKKTNVEFTVQDNGIGIPAEYQKKIFEKFFRVPSGDVHNTKGYGLGLSYVSGVVKSHNGSIEVESEPGKGSCFRIILPKKYG
ncbi:MAG TPA: HAMP domain-containing sensor histidine kinase [Chryseosolibacter sp.]|nr:HAMP domain-containing sensor histidine kinase [Chryseosolibacter sp.]